MSNNSSTVSSVSFETVLKMHAHPERNADMEKKINTLGQIVKGVNEPCLVLLNSDTICRHVTVFLRSMELQTSILTSEMFDGKERIIADEERCQFLKAKGAHAMMCSLDAFANAKMPLCQNYIFFEMPSKLSRFPKILRELEPMAHAEHRMVRIDVIVSESEPQPQLKALFMEMDCRGNVPPVWLGEKVGLISKKCAKKPSPDDQTPVRTSVPPPMLHSFPTPSSDSSDSPPTKAPCSSLVEKEKKKRFLWENPRIEMNSEGKYVIPVPRENSESDCEINGYVADNDNDCTDGEFEYDMMEVDDAYEYY
ncbi:unnamed protein product [Caenorhabditis sp. 36 PRJEB53466]|nr:unnamed protein product [Caenorhabditis sp. 36 PRJEB53466]